MTHAESISFDSIAAAYDESRGGVERGRACARALAALLDPRLPLLEVGVGTGVVALGLAELGFSVAGLDLSPAMLARARERIGPAVACADATDMPVATGSIPQIIVVWVLHVAPAEGVMSEIARVLAPGGLCAVVSSSPAADPSSDVGRVFGAMLTALDPGWVEGRLDDPATVVALGGRYGLEHAGSSRIESRYDASPAQVLARIEARAFSRLVGLDRQRWREVVEPALSSLRALDDPDRKRPESGVNEVTVLSRPA